MTAPTSTHLLSAKYSKKCEGCVATQVMFANKIECIGGITGLHLGQNSDRNRKIFLVPGEIFIDISHNMLAVANLISKIFNLPISSSGIKILIDHRNVFCNSSNSPLSVGNVRWQKPRSLALMLTIIPV